MQNWICTTAYEVEKPWTDSEYGCQYYYPVIEVSAETRGRAKAEALDKLRELYDFLEFTDICARLDNIV